MANTVKIGAVDVELSREEVDVLMHLQGERHAIMKHGASDPGRLHMPAEELRRTLDELDLKGLVRPFANAKAPEGYITTPEGAIDVWLLEQEGLTPR